MKVREPELGRHKYLYFFFIFLVMTCTSYQILVTGDLINELEYDTVSAAKVIQGSSLKSDE